MGPRRCTIEGCKSISGRPQHRGVTFHTIPNNPVTRQNWMTNCRLDQSRKITKSVLICSRHFLRIDFQTLTNNKYMLKQGAEPTIFPWTHATNTAITTAIRSADGTSSSITQIVPIVTSGVAGPSKISEEDRIVNRILEEALKSDKEASLKRAAAADVVEPKAKIRKSLDTTMYNKISAAAAAATVPSGDPPSSPLRSGADIEAQDFNGVWHPAKVIEEDHDDNEVLVKFNTVNMNIIDEWIPKDSSRLRVPQEVEVDSPQQMLAIDESTEIIHQSAASPAHIPLEQIQQQIIQTPQPSPLQSNLPVLKKAPYNYVVGEKCMAKWTDGRKWKATVQTVLDLDYYDILYIDGITKRCHAKDMSKIKGAQPPAPATTPKAAASSTGGRKSHPPLPIPKFDLPTLNLLPVPKDGEWCCNWVNDTPIGAEGYLEGPDGSRRPTVLVEDWRLPAGWTKHLYQRSSVSGKWDVVLVGPSKKRFRSKNDVKVYLDENKIPYNPDVYDFSIHKRRAKDLGLFVFTDDYKEAQQAKQQQLLQQSQADQRVNVSIASDTLNQSMSSEEVFNGFPPTELVTPDTSVISAIYEAPAADATPLEEGYVYVGSLKVQFIDNLYRCPEATCNKNFRKESHLQIHVKHYHEDLAKLMGVCLNMSDLAYIRTTGEMPVDEESQPGLTSPKSEGVGSKKSKLADQPEHASDMPSTSYAVQAIVHQEAVPPVSDPTFLRPESPPPLDSDPDMADRVAEQLLELQSNRSHHKKYKKSAKVSKNRIKIKLKNRNGTMVTKGRGRQPRPHSSLRNPNRTGYSPDASYANDYEYDPPYRGHDTHTATPHKSNRLKFLNHQVSTMCDPNVYEPPTQPPSQYIDENGEVIKIVRMRQEEIINCICAYAEEDGLMIQCELCLCWQHGFCHGIEKESLVPDKYVCYICQNPQSGRPSMKYVHDQEWLYEGRLPVSTKWLPPTGEVGDEAAPTVPPRHKERFEKLKHSHTLTGNLLDLKRFMHSLQVKINIAENKDHPKMYLWAKKWERSPPQSSNEVAGIEPLVSAVTASSAADDKKIITDTELNDILHQEEDKKCAEVKIEFQQAMDDGVDASALPTVDEVQVINDLMTDEEAMKHMEKAAEEIAKTEVKLEDAVTADAEKGAKSEDATAGDLDSNILAGLLTSPGGTNIDLVGDIKTEPRASLGRHTIEAIVPQPEAAIDPVECQLKLLDHIQKQQMLAMARLQSIEADIIGLEAMDEHADAVDPNDNFSSTKQTIFQLLSDLMKMRKLAALNVAEDEQLATATAVL